MVEITVDSSVLNKLSAELEKMLSTNAVGLAIHDSFARYCNPYVPMDEGILAQSTQIQKDSVSYHTPYAHYQYIGEVYGPNIPIKDKDGNITGWFSRPNQPKQPTGRKINYDTSKHPLATDHWDKAMMRDRSEEFEKEVGEIITRRLCGGQE